MTEHKCEFRQRETTENGAVFKSIVCDCGQRLFELKNPPTAKVNISVI